MKTIFSICYSTKPLLWAVALFFSGCINNYAFANGGFSGGVTPARFELQANKGDTMRRTLSIYNLGDRPEQFRVKTSDWSYSAEGQLTFSDSLTEDSCRPWIKLERHKIKVLPSTQRPRKFRFEVHVPESAEPRECRFAIMIESLGEDYLTSIGDGSISLPATGKIAVIVYLGINGVKSDLTIENIVTRKLGGQTLPYLKVTNTGAAHGRLDSELSAKDASGKHHELSVATSPIMPGQTRYYRLNPTQTEPNKKASLNYPLTISGRIFSDSQTFRVNQTVAGN